MLKFNVDEAGKQSSASIGGVLRDDRADVLCLFSEGVEIRDSNEAEVLAIFGALRTFSRSFQGSLIVESDSLNEISCVSHETCKLWKLHFIFNEIKALVSHIHVVFRYEVRSANGLADSLAKQGADRVVPWEVLL